MADIKLYSGTFCPFCKKVEAFIEENNLNDKIPVVYTDKSEEARDELIEGGGKRQVPCLYHNGQWLYESNEIIDFIKNECL